jgi:cellulose synthase/poly-beta-1,6-N-acetylglucosamine synthase-like glycosyltransferase
MTGLLGTGNDAILLLLVALNLAATLVIVAAARLDVHDRRRQTLVDISTIERSELTTALSVIVPTREHAHEIVRSVRALLDSGYPTLEVIVVDDGSQDGTIEALRVAFSLVQVDRVPRSRLRTGRVIRAYASPLDARLLVIDKEPGGRADALNTGLRFARYPLVCPVDPRLELDRDALVRLVRPFQTDPATIACGASTRIATGSGTPAARLQSLARRRISLISRVAAGRLGGPLLGRGALAIFSRDIVVSAGGYGALTDGEDLELVLRLHRHCRDGGLRYRIVSLARPAGSFTASGGLISAWQQARAARRGVSAAVAAQRGMLLRRRYGTLGLLVLPGLALGSLLRRPVALAGAGCAVAGLALGPVAPSLMIIDCVLLASATAGLSLAALLLDGASPSGLPAIADARSIVPIRRSSQPRGDPGATLIG